MTVIGVTMVRDEADVIGRTIRHMLANVDAVTVADNGSTDDTRPILEKLRALYGADRLEVIDDPEPGYYQSRKMTALAMRAAAAGADWVVPFDADEIWLPRTAGTIRDALEPLPGEALIADAPIFNHVPSPDGFDWRRAAPLPLRKVACRPLEGFKIEAGNHGAKYTDKVPLVAQGQLEVRHFPYRSTSQFIRKARNGAAAYAAAGDDLPADLGAHWRDYGRLLENEGEDALRAVFAEYFYSTDPEADPELVRDPCPTLT